MSEHADLQSLKEYTGEDRFNYLHRHEAGLDRHYATDVDLVLVEKHPHPHIPAFLEFKRDGEPIRFTQALLFDQLREFAPVFVIEATTDVIDTDPDEHRFTVKRFVCIHDIAAHPPEVELEVVRENIPWGGLVTYSTPLEWKERGGDSLIGFEEALRNSQFGDSNAETLSDTHEGQADPPEPDVTSLDYFRSEGDGQ